MIHKLSTQILLGWISLMSIGCNRHETVGELQATLSEIRHGTATPSAAAEERIAYLPFRYDNDSDNTPFGVYRPVKEQATAEPKRPAQRGPQQHLENFPLDTIQLVGMLSRNGQRRALLKVEGIIYQTVAGDYLGKDFGMIKSIGEQEIALEELLHGADNGWIKRSAKLEMQGIQR